MVTHWDPDSWVSLDYGDPVTTLHETIHLIGWRDEDALRWEACEEESLLHRLSRASWAFVPMGQALNLNGRVYLTPTRRLFRLVLQHDLFEVVSSDTHLHRSDSYWWPIGDTHYFRTTLVSIDPLS